MLICDKECRKYATDPLVYHGDVKRELLVAELVALDNLCADIEKIKIPIMFLHGSADPFVPYQESLNAFNRMASTDKRVKIYEVGFLFFFSLSPLFSHFQFKGAEHELVNETNKEEVIKDLMEFIQHVTGVN